MDIHRNEPGDFVPVPISIYSSKVGQIHLSLNLTWAYIDLEVDNINLPNGDNYNQGDIIQIDVDVKNLNMSTCEFSTYAFYYEVEGPEQIRFSPLQPEIHLD